MSHHHRYRSSLPARPGGFGRLSALGLVVLVIGSALVVSRWPTTGPGPAGQVAGAPVTAPPPDPHPITSAADAPAARPVVEEAAPAGTGETAAPAAVEEPAPAATPPGTVMIVGDSSMFDESPALVAGFAGAGWEVIDTAYPGIGVTRPGATLRRTWGREARRLQPDLVVVMLGGWDIDWARRHGDDAYRAALDDAVAALSSSGGRLLWLSMLPGGKTADRPVERFFAELPARHPSVTYLDIEHALRVDDAWPVRRGDEILRKPDEWHLCPDGAAAVARLVLARVGVDDAGLDQPGWRADPRYDDPPGGCAR